MSKDKPSPKNCCGTKPEQFTDTKVGRTERMWVISCATCGAYADSKVLSQAVTDWNNGQKQYSPGSALRK